MKRKIRVSKTLSVILLSVALVLCAWRIWYVNATAYKKTARIIVSIDFLLFLILYITGTPTRYLATWALSLSAVAIMMVITLFEKNSTRRESV